MKKIKMVRVALDVDERYPDYQFKKGDGTGYTRNIQVSEDVLERWEKALADYEAMQKELKSFYQR